MGRRVYPSRPPTPARAAWRTRVRQAQGERDRYGAASPVRARRDYVTVARRAERPTRVVREMAIATGGIRNSC